MDNKIIYSTPNPKYKYLLPHNNKKKRNLNKKLNRSLEDIVYLKKRTIMNWL